MALNAQNILIIEKYLDGELTAAEKQIFDAQMASNTEFKAEVNAYETALQAIRVAGRDHIRHILAEEEAKFTMKKDELPCIPLHITPVKRLATQRWLMAAASISVLVIATFLLTRPDKPENSDGMTQTPVKPYKNIWITTSRGQADEEYLKSIYGDDKARQLTEGFDAYQADKFEEAAHILSRFDIEKDSFYFYRGNAFLMINETDKAILDFNKVTSDEKSLLKPQTEWYLMRAYFLKNNKEQAKILEQKILNDPNHPYNSEVSKLKKK